MIGNQHLFMISFEQQLLQIKVFKEEPHSIQLGPWKLWKIVPHKHFYMVNLALMSELSLALTAHQLQNVYSKHHNC
jgi:hypothetical protein